MYGVMDEVLIFANTFREYPPRSVPPSFNPATIMEGVMEEIKDQPKKSPPAGAKKKN
jgi:arylsulfatase